MKFAWIEPLFYFGRDIDHIAVTPNAEGVLDEMSKELLATGDLIAIYIPEGSENAATIPSTRGRIVGAVRLVEMREGTSTADYADVDIETDKIRWPHGWPCEVVYCPPVPYRGLFPSPPLFDRMPTYRTQGKRSLNFLSAPFIMTMSMSHGPPSPNPAPPSSSAWA